MNRSAAAGDNIEAITLRRVLGLPALMFFGLVYMVPLTVFTTYGVVTVMSGGRTALAYVATLIAMIFTALSYGSMVRKCPVAGSAYSYASLSFGPGPGFLVGWSLLLDYLFLPMINYLVIGLFLNTAFPAVPAWAFIVAAVALVTFFNIRGIGSVSGVSNALVAAQVAFVLVFVVMSGRSLVGAEVDLLAPLLGDGSRPGLAPLMAGSAVLCLSFLGFDAISTLSEEAREPLRDIPRAIVLATLGAGVLFVFLAFVSQLILPGSRFANADTAANEVMRRAGGGLLENLFTAAFVAGAVGSALASQASVSRILFSMGRDGLLPRRFFGALSERYRTPTQAILLVSLVSLFAILSDLTTLASMINFGALVAFSAVNLAVIRTYLLDGRRHGLAEKLRYGLFPLIGFALMGWLWTSLSKLTLAMGLGWFAAGLIYLAAITRGFRRPVPQVRLSESST